MLGKGKKSSLEQYQRNAAGEYIYTGKYFTCTADGTTRRRTLFQLWLLMGAMAGGSVAVGLFPAPGTTNTFYVLIPMVAEIILAMSCLWALGQLSAGGEPLKEYVYGVSVKKLPGRLTAVTVLAGLTALMELLYLLLNGGWGAAVMAVLGLEGLAAGLSLWAKYLISTLKWVEKG